MGKLQGSVKQVFWGRMGAKLLMGGLNGPKIGACVGIFQFKLGIVYSDY